MRHQENESLDNRNSPTGYGVSALITDDTSENAIAHDRIGSVLNNNADSIDTRNIGDKDSTLSVASLPRDSKASAAASDAEGASALGASVGASSMASLFSENTVARHTSQAAISADAVKTGAAQSDSAATPSSAQGSVPLTPAQAPVQAAVTQGATSTSTTTAGQDWFTPFKIVLCICLVGVLVMLALEIWRRSFVNDGRTRDLVRRTSSTKGTSSRSYRKSVLQNAPAASDTDTQSSDVAEDLAPSGKAASESRPGM
jgi:hypothetical protein